MTSNTPNFDAHALLIGVGDYKYEFTDLPATIHDAESLGNTLIREDYCAYPDSQVNIVTGTHANLNGARRELSSLVDNTSIDSTCLIYFSGHGANQQLRDGIESYLCVRDTNPSKLSESAISGAEFSALLARIPSKRLLVLIDTCHSAGTASFKGFNLGVDKGFLSGLSQGTGKIIITSSTQSQFSFVDGELSLFTRYLISGLTGDADLRGTGFIHVLDLFHYVSDMVRKKRPNQTPILKAKDLDLNFPVALSPTHKSSVQDTKNPMNDIREVLVSNPLKGAAMLSKHLMGTEEWKHKQLEVDLRRRELESLQNNMELFGPNSNDKSEFNRALYALLRICAEVY